MHTLVLVLLTIIFQAYGAPRVATWEDMWSLLPEIDIDFTSKSQSDSEQPSIKDVLYDRLSASNPELVERLKETDIDTDIEDSNDNIDISQAAEKMGTLKNELANYESVLVDDLDPQGLLDESAREGLQSLIDLVKTLQTNTD